MASSPTQRTLALPWPPSVNHYWRRVGARTLISRDGREYRRTVSKMAGPTHAMDGRLEVTILAYPPDRRRRDLDNVLKSLLDALEHAGVYRDDAQIDDLRILREGFDGSGAVVVTVRRVDVS